VLVWFRIILTTFRAKITTRPYIFVFVIVICLEHYWFHFSGHGVYGLIDFDTVTTVAHSVHYMPQTCLINSNATHQLQCQ